MSKSISQKTKVITLLLVTTMFAPSFGGSRLLAQESVENAALTSGTQNDADRVVAAEDEAASAEEPAPVPEAPPVTESEPPKAAVPEKKSGNAFSRFFRRLFNLGTDEDVEKGGGESPETEESQAGTPEVLTPEGEVNPDEFLAEEYRSASRPWEPPNYAGQENALGYSETAFAVPEGLRKRVDFWIDIYSKYTTNQGVLHDSVHVEVVYAPIDFTSIMKNSDLNIYQKAREREKLVNSRRKEFEERLKRLAKASSPDGLDAEDLRIWKMFEGIDEPNKFENAIKKGRVRFQLGQKDKTILGVYYSGRYIREMEKIFRESGLPIELTRLPFVESSFNIFARSKVGASGVWQFMRRTARPYMMVNPNVDERNDPIEATRASAKMLKSNYQMLQSWPLAVTGYNHGPSGVARIVKKTGTKDLAKIVNMYSSRTFGFASENFYACFLAALEVERNARKYFGDVKWSTEFDNVEVAVKRAVPYKALLAWYDGDESMARLQNFHLQAPVRKGRSMIPKGTFVRVPRPMQESALAFINGSIGLPKSLKLVSASEGETVIRAAPPETADDGAVAPKPRSSESQAAAKSMAAEDTDTSGNKRYKVRRGDNLSRIAKQFGVSVSELKKANDIDGDGKLRRGQWLTIPK